MKAIVFPGDHTAPLQDFADPVAGSGQVVVRMRASGMCGTDLHYYRGTVDFGAGTTTIQGHEPCGDVYALGPGVDEAMIKPGDRVMVHHYFGCQYCRSCRSGWPQMCETAPAKIMSVSAHGAHAPYAVVPAAALVTLPDQLSYQAGATLGCGTGTAWGGIKRVGNIGDSTVVVLGQGPVGLSATMFAAAMGARVIAVDIDSSRLDRATHFGAHEVINSREVDAAEAIKDLTHGHGANVALETSGHAGDDALQVLGPWGRAAFIGLPGRTQFSVQEGYRKQLTLMTVWTMSIPDLIDCAQFVVDKKLPIDDLFVKSWKLEEATEAYQWLDQVPDGKGYFTFDA